MRNATGVGGSSRGRPLFVVGCLRNLAGMNLGVLGAGVEVAILAVCCKPGVLTPECGPRSESISMLVLRALESVLGMLKPSFPIGMDSPWTT